MTEKDPGEIRTMMHVRLAEAHAVAIVRMCQFAVEHADATDHAYGCELWGEPDEWRQNYEGTAVGIDTGIESIERRLRVVEIYVARLADLVIDKTRTEERIPNQP